MSLLNKINKSSDLKQFNPEQMKVLTEEIRTEIISIVAETGGHLASNLGAVELTLALHYCLDIPTDQIVWDVGHQSYVHKMLTGRREQMKTIRQHNGLAGFPKRSESKADPFGAGHASTAISAATGLAAARDQIGAKHKVVAVVGDGSLTGGLAFEGLNNAGASKKDLLVILNDNEMSISKNVGALSKYLTGIMVDQRFNKLRNEIWELTGRFKRRDKIRTMVSHIEDSIRGLFVPGYIFDRLGFRYFGPIDGHDLPLMIKMLDRLKEISGPLLLHVVTVKGKGYALAEADATKFHGIGAFDKITGKTNSVLGKPPYTKVFGDAMVELGNINKNIAAITAAMSSGTGLAKFAEAYPDRFYDVGIAEGHAVCFAAGLAAGGVRPFVAIYSTFLQRAYDQIIHDVALQKLPVVFCVDRGGLVGDDGPTHHGTFDLSYMSTVPGMTVMVPKDGNELRAMLHAAATTELTGTCAIRYHRASIPDEIRSGFESIEWGSWEKLYDQGDTVIIAAGTMVETAKEVRENLIDKYQVAVINARFVKPLNSEMLDYCQKNYKNIITLEENVLSGGLGQAIGAYLKENDFAGRFHAIGLPDKFVTHGNVAILLAEIGLDAAGVTKYIEQNFDKSKTDSTKGVFARNIFAKFSNSNRITKHTGSGKE